MPRGNDTAGNSIEAAAIRSQYGDYPNADEMIRGVRASLDPAVMKASLIGIDEDATATLKEEDGLAEVGSRFDLGEGESLVDFNVRGNAIVGVIENAQGIYRKAVVGADDTYRTPALSPAEAELKAQADHDRRIASETARLRAVADERIREAEEKENARVAKAIAEFREQADAQLEEAQAEAAEAEASETSEADTGDAEAEVTEPETAPEPPAEPEAKQPEKKSGGKTEAKTK